MNCPEKYIKENGMQRRDVNDILHKFVKQMIWKPNEVVLDIGCGPGDVTTDILFPFLKNKIQQMVGVDKSKQMIAYAKKTYGCSKIDFKVLDIENSNDCTYYSHSFNKIFSFYCLHWVCNKVNALINMHLMLKSGGDILIQFLLRNPLVELYKYMDAEWQKYIQDITQISHNFYSQEEVKDILINAGFQIISIESSIQKYTFPDFSSLLNAIKVVDDIYNVLPPHLHDRYSIHVKDKICEKQMVDICPTTAKITIQYLPIIVHAIKD